MRSRMASGRPVLNILRCSIAWHKRCAIKWPVVSLPGWLAITGRTIIMEAVILSWPFGGEPDVRDVIRDD